VKLSRPGGTVYPGTKVLLQHVTQIARLELEKDGIVVGIVHPYITNTPFFQNLEATGGDADEPAAVHADYLSRAQLPEKPAAAIVEMIESGVPEISLIPEELVSESLSR
jgi:short-subunit dehydrogenase